MNNLNWVENSGIVLILHLVILVLAIFNFNYQFLVANKERQNAFLEIEINQLEIDIKDLTTSSNLQSFDVFRDREIRIQGYKLPGEVVIDTSVIEPVLEDANQRRNYIPEITRESENRFQRWMDCLFYGNSSIKQETFFCRYKV